MFNRLQAIRAAVFGISFVILCLFIGMLLGMIIHTYTPYTDTLIILSFIGLPLATLCVTWATLKPYVIYGGMHSIVWFVGIAASDVFKSPLPFAISLFATIFLFVQLDPIMLFLHNLKRPRILFNNTMPKQSRYEPGASYYEEGYQSQNVSQDNEQTLFYPQSSDFEEKAQLQYPEMRQ
jgi:hypothetical protein